MNRNRLAGLAFAAALATILTACGDDHPSRPSANQSVTRRVSASKGAALAVNGLTLRIPSGVLAADGDVTLSVESEAPLAFDDLIASGPVYSITIDAAVAGEMTLEFAAPGAGGAGEIYALFDDGSHLGIGRLAAGEGSLNVPYSPIDLRTVPGNEVKLWLAVKRDFAAIVEPLDPDILGIHHLGRRAHTDEDLIVLIHGLASSHQSAWEAAGTGEVSFRSFLEGLLGSGAVVWSFQYDTDAPIEASAELLGTTLASRLASERPRITLLAHSMGGLVARRFLKSDANASLVEQAILLGVPNNGAASDSSGVRAPHRGAYSAFISIDRALALRSGFRPSGLVGRGALEMRPGSGFLSTLNTAAPDHIEMNLLLVGGDQEGWLSGTIGGPDDGFVAGASAIMDFPGHEVYSGIEIRTVPAGHWQMTESPEVRTAVREYLGRVEAASVPSALAPTSLTLMDNGCVDWPDSVLWTFKWSRCSGADRYQLSVEGPPGAPAELALGSIDVFDTTYTHRVLGAYVDAELVRGWRWKVRAHIGDIWGPWCAEQPFKLETPTRDCPSCYYDLPVTGVFLTGAKVIPGNTRYGLSVTGYQDLPHSGFFMPAPHFAACEGDQTAGRVRVDILDTEGAVIESFCEITDRNALFDKIWFDLPVGETPPDSVSVRLVDLYCGQTFTSAPVSTKYGLCYPDMPSPILEITGKHETSTGVEYSMRITNLDQIPAYLFAPATDLPACGLNKSSSRTWVDVRTNVSGVGYSYCALNWEYFKTFTMSASKSTTLPSYYYMVWTDRRCGKTYRTNNASTDVPSSSASNR